jgi:hypothetical protein
VAALLAIRGACGKQASEGGATLNNMTERLDAMSQLVGGKNYEELDSGKKANIVKLVLLDGIHEELAQLRGHLEEGAR